MESDSLLLRQVHPNFIQSDIVSSAAFKPNSNDNGEMSVDDGEKIDCKTSFEFYTGVRQKKSAGVWAITPNECTTEGLKPGEAPLPDAEWHCVVDYNALPPNRWERVAKLLKMKALGRGCQFKPK